MRIYLDNCCYNRPYDDQSQMRVVLETKAKLYIQELVKDGKVDLITSYMLDVENGQNPHSMRRTAISPFMDAFSADYVGFDRAPELSGAIREIMATGVKPKDATHIACAVCAECQFFLTTDMRLLKYSSDKIIVENPVEFVKKWVETWEEREHETQ